MEASSEPQLNEKAVAIVKRISDKLSGMDFGNREPISVGEQVDKLIVQATDHENLAQCFAGWVAVW